MFQYELGDSVFSCVVLRKLPGKHIVVSKLMAAKKEHVPGICLVGEAKSFSISYSMACPHQLLACCSVSLHDKGHCECTTRGKLRAVGCCGTLWWLGRKWSPGTHGIFTHCSPGDTSVELKEGRS